MGIFKGLAKVVLSPIRGVAEIGKDLTDSESANGLLTIMTLGASSVIKGTAKGIKDGVEEIYEE